MDIHYRRLLPADAAQYRSVRLACLQAHPNSFGATYAQQVLLPKLHMEARIEAQDDDAVCMGAFDGGQLVGIAAFMREGTERRRHIAEVIQVYVEAAYGGRKVGEGLMRALVAEAWRQPGIEQLLLHVVTSAGAAVRVYGQVGFEQCGFLHNYMKMDGHYEDAYVMVLFKPREG